MWLPLTSGCHPSFCFPAVSRRHRRRRSRPNIRGSLRDHAWVAREPPLLVPWRLFSEDVLDNLAFVRSGRLPNGGLRDIMMRPSSAYCLARSAASFPAMPARRRRPPRPFPQRLPRRMSEPGPPKIAHPGRRWPAGYEIDPAIWRHSISRLPPDPRSLGASPSFHVPDIRAEGS